MSVQVGDYVVPDDEYAHIVTPCRVTHVFKSGNIRARSDDGALYWRGPADEFKVVNKK